MLLFRHLPHYQRNWAMTAPIKLFGWTAICTLCVVQQKVTHPYNGPMLQITPRPDGQIEFRYIDTPIIIKQWCRICSPDQVPQTLNNIIKPLNWSTKIVTYPSDNNNWASPLLTFDEMYFLSAYTQHWHPNKNPIDRPQNNWKHDEPKIRVTLSINFRGTRFAGLLLSVINF